MRPSVRLALVPSLVAALAIAGLVAAPLPASADAQSFILKKSVYGPNETVAISGSLTFNCDTWSAVSDIYVVRTGSVAQGSHLEDASGAPNTLEGTLFFDPLAFTYPSGNLGPGTYDIVEDTCQDGIFDATDSDSILTGAIHVDSYPMVTLPSNIVAVKGDAARLWGEYERVIPKIEYLFLLAEYGIEFAAVFKDPKRIFSLILAIENTGFFDRVRLSYIKMWLDVALHFKSISDDPPDPDFAEP